MNSKIFISTLLALIPASIHAANISFGAAMSSGFALSDGTDLATGSLIRFGTFSLTSAQITTNAGNLSLLESSFTELTSAVIGEGNPALGTSDNDPVNSGLFNHALNGIDTTPSGLNIAGKSLYYWVYNAPTVVDSTQHGIFSSSLWTIPSGGVLDFGTSLDTDIVNLTTNDEGLLLDPSAIVAVGSFGGGTNVTGGGVEFNLAPIPEPSTAVLIAGTLGLGLALGRRRPIPTNAILS